MKTRTMKNLLHQLTVATAALVPALAFAAGPAPVNLRSAAHFTILAGAAITTTGGGPIHGDVGAYPITGAAIALTDAQVEGVIYSVDAAGPAGCVIDPALLLAAKGDLTTAYIEARDRTPVPDGPYLNPGAGNLGGLDLIPGLYKITGSTLITGSNLTLTGGPDDVWIFQCGADLLLGSSIQVILAGGAQARNVFWQVGTSATIGTFAVLRGTIMADQAITMDTSSTMEGRALAFTAGVTFNGAGGSLPVASAPTIAAILVNDATGFATVVVETTPYALLSLQTSSRLIPQVWTTIDSSTPATSLCSFTNDAPTLDPRLFYRAVINSY